MPLCIWESDWCGSLTIAGDRGAHSGAWRCPAVRKKRISHTGCSSAFSQATRTSRQVLGKSDTAWKPADNMGKVTLNNTGCAVTACLYPGEARKSDVRRTADPVTFGVERSSLTPGVRNSKSGPGTNAGAASATWKTASIGGWLVEGDKPGDFAGQRTLQGQGGAGRRDDLQGEVVVGGKRCAVSRLGAQVNRYHHLFGA